VVDKKNILVTGGAGFIGSHLCDALVKEAHVICMDNFSTSHVSNIQHLLQHPNFEFINHDITQPFQLTDFPELEQYHVGLQGVQEIYHLACPISKLHFEDFKIASILASSIGTKHVLDVAVASKAKVLFGSSSALYGSRREGQVYANETDPCVLDHLTPFGAYDEGKRFAEAILYTYGDVYSLDVKIARLFRTYGPRMKIADGNLIPDMVNAALDGKDIVLSCREEEKISLCYVSDMVDGLIKYMHASTDISVMNLGSDQEYSVTEIAKKILRTVESTAQIHCKADGTLSKEAPLPDIGRARQALHWLPLVQLDQGLAYTIQDARSRRTQMHAFG